MAIILILTLHYISSILNIPSIIVINRAVFEFSPSLWITIPYLQHLVVLNVALIAAIAILRKEKLLPILLLIYSGVLYVIINEIYLVIYLTIALNISTLILLCIKNRREITKYMVKYLVIVLIVFEFLTIAYVMSIRVLGANVIPILVIFEKSIFAIPIAILPFITVALLFKWIADIFLSKKRIWHMSYQRRNVLVKGFDALIISLIIAQIIITIPYITNLGRPMEPISEDTKAYIRFLKLVDREGLYIPTQYQPHKIRTWMYVIQRPLHFLILYTVYKYMGIDPIILVDYIHHVVCISLIITLIWLISKKLFDDEVASLAALLTASGSLVLGFRIGGFQANELCMVILLTYLLLIIDVKRLWYIPCAIALSIISLLIHPWSSILFIISSIPLVCRLYLIDKNKSKLLRRISISIPSVLIPIVTLLIVIYYMGISDVLNIILFGIFPNEYKIIKAWYSISLYKILTQFWRIVEESNNAIFYYCWSTLSMPFIYIASLLTVYDPITFSLSAISSIMILIFSGAHYIYRYLLLTPFTITAALLYSRTNKHIQLLALIASFSTSLQIVLNSVVS